MKNRFCFVLFLALSIAVAAQKNSYLDFYNQGKKCLEHKSLDSAYLMFKSSLVINDKFGSSYFQIGNVFFKKARYDSAIINYDKAIFFDTSFAVFYLMKGSAFYEQKKYKSAISSLDICLMKDPDNTQALYKKGMCFYQQNNLDSSIAYMNSVLQRDPKNAQANKNLGSTYYKKEDYTRAISYFEKVVVSEPFNIELLNVLAICYEKIGLSEKANDTYRIIDKHNPQDPTMELSIAENRIDQKDFAGARAIYFSTLNKFDDRAIIYYYIANTYYNEKKYDSALLNYNQVYLLNDKFTGIDELMGNCFFNMKDYINAISYYDKAQGKKNTAEINNLIGLSYLKLNSFIKSKSYFKQAILLDRNYGIAYYNLGTVNYFLDEFEESISNLLKANMIIKNDADINKYLAKAYGKINDKANSILYFNQAVQLNPDVNDVFQLGTLYYEMNEFDLAIPQFETALKQGKPKGETLYNLGLCYVGLKNYNEALQLFTEALDSNAENKFILYSIANANFQLKDYKTAIVNIEQCIMVDANYANAYYLLGFAKYNTDKLREAKAAFIRAHQLDPNLEMPDMIK